MLRRSRGVFSAMAAAGMLTGCHESTPAGPVRLVNRTIGIATVAVAPALNLSGSTEFDPNRFADTMAAELSFAEGISVIPVSRVLGLLSAQGAERVESATHAAELVRLSGADAILVFAVTRYDPYDPPIIGITAQLYGARVASDGSSGNPAEGDVRPRLLAETQRVIDASHAAVADDVRAFAHNRSADRSPFGWRKYVVSQRHFIQYCCFATVRSLLDVEGLERLAGNRRETIEGP